MAHYQGRIAAIRDYFKLDGKPPSISEMKALTDDDKAELAAGIIADGHTIEGDGAK